MLGLVLYYLCERSLGQVKFLNNFAQMTEELIYNHLLFKVPFREAHGLSGTCVALAETKQCQLSDLTLHDYKTVK